MTMITAWPFDQGPGSSNNQQRWQKMGKVWSANGVVPAVVSGLTGALECSYTSNTITVQPGAVNINGTYGESATAVTLTGVTGNGMVVARLDNANWQIVLAFVLNQTVPTQTPATWEIPLYTYVASTSALTDVRVFTGPGTGANGALTGEIKAYAGGTAPGGWLVCDGSAVSRTTYSGLWYVMQNPTGSGNSPWGNGDGSTTFSLPDLRGRSPIGAGTGGGLSARALGTVGGEENHLLALGEIAAHGHAPTVSVSDPQHNHGMTGADDRNHSHNMVNMLTGALGTGYGLSNYAVVQQGIMGSPNTTGYNTGHLHGTGTTGTGIGVTVSLANSGGGLAHNNMQPWAVVNYIIKT